MISHVNDTSGTQRLISIHLILQRINGETKFIYCMTCSFLKKRTLYIYSKEITLDIIPILN